MDLNTILHQDGVTLDRVQQHLSSLTPDRRVIEATSLDRSRLAVMWALTNTLEEEAMVALDEIVPHDRPALQLVPFEGQNNLLAFRGFRKVFYRTSDGTVAGYNDQPMRWLTGPGYYVVKDVDGGALIDYTILPSERPSSLPDIQGNEKGVSSLVYGAMQDELRRVYGRIFIGRAIKKGKATENYFVLAHQ